MASFTPNPLFLHIYRTPGTDSQFLRHKLSQRYQFGQRIAAIETEFCFNVELERPLTTIEKEKLLWILTETFEPESVRENEPFLDNSLDSLPPRPLSQSMSTPSSAPSTRPVSASLAHSHSQGSRPASWNKDHPYHVFLIEVGPRMAFSTAWSSNSASMFLACGIPCIKRIERSRRFKVITTPTALNPQEMVEFTHLIHDRMTECVYSEPLLSFENNNPNKTIEPVITLPLMERGKAALEEFNNQQGLGFDDWDLQFYTNLFTQTLKRNPTDVECFDLAQSNSEHSRHWFFGGKMIIDGEEKKETLFQMVKSTLPKEGSNSIIAFHDNSSVIHFLCSFFFLFSLSY
jgi:phosphoribosylformylglycinamidine synthase